MIDFGSAGSCWQTMSIEVVGKGKIDKDFGVERTSWILAAWDLAEGEFLISMLRMDEPRLRLLYRITNSPLLLAQQVEFVTSAIGEPSRFPKMV